MSDAKSLLAAINEAGAGVVGIGTDLLDSQRIVDAYQRHGQRLVSRFLTPAEQQVFIARGHSVNYLAKRYCAKEALAKALGTGIAKGVGFQQLEVLNNDQGAPVVNLYGAAAERLAALGGQQALISLSDEHWPGAEAGSEKQRGALIQAFVVLV